MGIYDLFAIERIHHQQVLIRRSKRIKLGRLGKASFKVNADSIRAPTTVCSLRPLRFPYGEPVRGLGMREFVAAILKDR